jgi:hypothetical protein
VGNGLLVSGMSIFVAGNGSNSAVLAQYNSSGTLSHLTATNIGGNASGQDKGVGGTGQRGRECIL